MEVPAVLIRPASIVWSNSAHYATAHQTEHSITWNTRLVPSLFVIVTTVQQASPFRENVMNSLAPHERTMDKDWTIKSWYVKTS
jgi:hypothetical protein